jgi:transposase
MAHSTASIPTPATRMSVELPTTLGLDLSDRQAHFHVQQGDGRTLTTGKVAMERDDLAKLFDYWKGCRLVIEAGCHSPWVSRLGHECGLEVMVANPRQIELITKSDHKTDSADAEALADLGRSNPKLLYPIVHRTEEAQTHLAVQRARNEAVRTRTAMINHVRGVLKSHGHRAPSVSPECFGTRAAASIPLELTAALKPMLELIQAVNRQIKGYDKEIVRLGNEQYPIVQVLQQISGVGPILSLTFVLTLETPWRFESGREVGAFAGLVPRKKSSGKSDPKMHITKAGDRELRRLLVLAANYILGRFGPDCDLRRFGMKIVGSGTDKTAKKRARVAVARKLAVLMHHLWRTGEVYDPFYMAKKRGEPLPA